MIKRIKEWLLSFKPEEIAGSLIPIVKCTKYTEGLQEQYIKTQIVQKMLPELMNYIVWDAKKEENGVVLLSGRIDVLRRDG